MGSLRAARVIVVVAGWAIWSVAGGADWHVSTDDESRPLFARSAFVHGYMHGYEQGFHAGDLDLQMGRPARDPQKLPEFREVAGYDRKFGDKGSFSTGYYQGFRVGFDDSISQRPFRAVTQIRAAARGLIADNSVKPSKWFDQGLVAGYKGGLKQGRGDAGSGAALREVVAPCQPVQGDAEYCDGFARGFRLGYADGYTSQAPPALAQEKHK